VVGRCGAHAWIRVPGMTDATLGATLAMSRWPSCGSRRAHGEEVQDRGVSPRATHE
jgi:hypothetical protein